MNLLQILNALKSDPDFSSSITAWTKVPPRPARCVPFSEILDTRLTEILQKRGIKDIYIHQDEAFNRVSQGENIVVVTPTASGKTLCYNLPVLNTILKDPNARALYLFPTKALSQDQMNELVSLITDIGADIKTYTFDGDTPASARKAIRMAGHVVITNPDMLHMGILPHHTNWIKLFENLRFVVIDEIHHYRGIFGSHVANVIRRLKRICRFYGSDPQFICCSATIANPEELAVKIAGQPVRLIDDNGAPTAEKHIIFFNPAVVNRELGIRKSSVKEARWIAARFLSQEIQTILFARSRIRVEILMTYLREAMRELKKDPERIHGYRGGYLPNERRQIERGLRSGDVLGVVSTNALELGIDIGQLEVSIMVGYPGSIASTWQQAGRAGRRSGLSVAILIASSSPLDQYIITHPDYFLGKSPESGIVDPDNLVILMSHLKCAAFELPFRDGEKFGTDATLQMLEYLEKHRVLRHVEGLWHWMSDIYPAQSVSLRSASPENFVIIDRTKENRVVGEVDYNSAPELLHPDAIYIHHSNQYQVEDLDWDGKKAYVREVDVDYFTDAESKTTIKVLRDERCTSHDTYELHLGEVSVTTQAVLYKKIKLFTHENIGSGRINLPELELQTTSFWVQFDEELVAELSISGEDFSGALRGLATVMGQVATVFVMCDTHDIRAIPMVKAPFSGLPTIYIYDNTMGGVGFSEKIFSRFEDIVRSSVELIKPCPCEKGCPSCVGTVMEVGERGKYGAFKLAGMLYP